MIYSLIAIEMGFAKEIQGCAMLKAVVNQYSQELETQIVMQKNRILPFRRYGSSRNKVEVHYKDIWIPLSVKYIKMGPRGLCSVKPHCATANAITTLYSEPDGKSKKLSLVYEDQKMTLLGRQKINGVVWAQVDLGDKIAWIEGEKVVIENKACGISRVRNSNWSLEAEIGTFTSKRINEFSNLFHYDSNQNLATARDPIYRVTSITSQQSSLSAVFSKNRQAFSVGLGALQRTWNYRILSDFRFFVPPSTCQIDAPVESRGRHQEQFLNIPISYRYLLYSKGHHKIRFRPQAQILYSLQPNFVYSFYNPCRVGVSSIEKSNMFQAHGIMSFDYIYQFKKIDLGLSLGIENSTGIAFSLLLGF